MKNSQLQEFLQSALRNKWIKLGAYELYVRKSRRLINGHSQQTFDLATINRPDNKLGTGGFKKLLPEIIKAVRESGCEIFYIENILNARLYAYLLSIGFMECLDTTPPCMYVNTIVWGYEHEREYGGIGRRNRLKICR